MNIDQIVQAFQSLTIEQKLFVMQQVMPELCRMAMRDAGTREQMMAMCREMMSHMDMAGPDMMRMMMEMMGRE